MINTHGYKMTGLRKAAGETKGLQGYYAPGYLQINYDKGTGEVWANYHYDLGHSWHCYYHDADIVSFDTYDPMTMQQIADQIKDTIDWQ